jgi:putative ABC transport system permease protein
VYGVLAFAVGQRTREVGVRMALGARPEQIVRLFFREGVRRVVPGLITGVALGIVVAKVLSSEFYGVEPLDAVAFVGVAALLSAVASLATWLPARRAARVNPTVALKSE